MFTLTIEMSVPELAKHPIEVPCPICELHTWVTLGEIARREMVICRGCHANVRLEDSAGSVSRLQKRIVDAMKDWERSFG